MMIDWLSSLILCYDPEAKIIVAQTIKKSHEHSFFSLNVQNVLKNIGLL